MASERNFKFPFRLETRSRRAISNFKLKEGVTLVEILVGLAIFGFISILVAAVYLSHFRLFSNQSTSIEVASQNRLALDEITNQIRESQSVVTTCPACGGDTTDSQILILQLWPLNASGEPYDPGGTNYDYIVYRLDPADNTKIIKKILPSATSTRSGSTKVLIVDVSGLEFTYNNPPDVTAVTEVTVTVTTSAKALEKNQTFTQSAKATLRNK